VWDGPGGTSVVQACEDHPKMMRGRKQLLPLSLLVKVYSNPRGA
jgi:hypothetical protein